MKRIFIITLSINFFVSIDLSAQSVVGFWKVDQVSVGDENLTPVAKWFRYNKDKTYVAGNGWSQNDVGTWEYDKKKMEFLPESVNGPDEYGAFTVSFVGKGMKWERMEDGMKVIVLLSRISEMPMAPRDSIAGNWELTTVTGNGKEITSTHDPDNKETILVRWTGTYRKTNPDGSQSFGYWHMDAHKPEFHLIDFNREVEVQIFDVAFKNDQVIMRLKGDKNTTFTYKRR